VACGGQNAKAWQRHGDPGGIPDKHVGDTVTLSDRANDNSFAMFARLREDISG